MRHEWVFVNGQYISRYNITDTFLLQGFKPFITMSTVEKE